MRSEPDAMPEMKRFVDDAVVAEIIVVEANGMVETPLKVGEAEKTTFPVPVSSESHEANWSELEKRLDVAICVHVFPAPPMRSWFADIVERPVPPLVAASVPVVSPIAIPRLEVASAVGTPAAPDEFARMEFAAIDARPRETFEPPI